MPTMQPVKSVETTLDAADTSVRALMPLHGKLEKHVHAPRCVSLTGPGDRSVLMPPKKDPRQFDDQNGNHHHFQQKRAGLMELVDHEFVEIAGGAELLVH